MSARNIEMTWLGTAFVISGLITLVSSLLSKRWADSLHPVVHLLLATLVLFLLVLTNFVFGAAWQLTDKEEEARRNGLPATSEGVQSLIQAQMNIVPNQQLSTASNGNFSTEETQQMLQDASADLSDQLSRMVNGIREAILGPRQPKFSNDFDALARGLQAGLVKPSAQRSARRYDDVCGVCTGEPESGDVMARLPCGHAFHAFCLPEWFKINETCGSCRSAVRGIEEVKLEKVTQ